MALFSGVPFFNLRPQDTQSDGRTQAALSRGLDRAFRSRDNRDNLSERARQFDAQQDALAPLRESQAQINEAQVKLLRSKGEDTQAFATYFNEVVSNPNAVPPTMKTPEGQKRLLEFRQQMEVDRFQKNGAENAVELTMMLGSLPADKQADYAEQRRESGGKFSGDTIRNITLDFHNLPKPLLSTPGKQLRDRQTLRPDEVEAFDALAQGDQFTTRVITNPDGTITTEIIRGKPGSGDLSSSNVTRLQEAQIGIRNAQENIRKVKGNLRGKDVGIRGAFGELIFDGILPQIGFGKADDARTANRRSLRNIFEDMIPLVTVERRFTDRDVERIRALGPQLKAAQSLEQVNKLLDEVDTMFSDREIRNNIALQRFERLSISDFQKAVANGDMTLEDARNELRRQNQLRAPTLEPTINE